MQKDTVEQKLNRPESLTHQHLVAVINTILCERLQRNSQVDILDMGCGNGHLLDFMQTTLPKLRPDFSFTFYGLDVYDAWGQFEENMAHTRSYLSSRHPTVDWERNLRFLSMKEPWSFPEEHFDFVVSNQVMEHVRDHDLVFSEVYRTLKKEGASVHLFPLQEVLWEGHVYMPLVHKAYNHDKMVYLMYSFARMGFKKRYHLDKSMYGWRSLREFAEDMSIVILSETNYVTYRRLVRLAKKNDLAISFVFSREYFIGKLLSYFGTRRYLYKKSAGLIEFLSFFFCKYIASVTVTLRKLERKKAMGQTIRKSEVG
jgi:SAM-dependent methyltransferase